MKKFEVTMTLSSQYTMTVEAEDWEQAEAIALSDVQERDFDFDAPATVDDVQEVDEFGWPVNEEQA